MVGFMYILYETLCREAVSVRYVHEMTFDPMCVWPNMCKLFASLSHDAIGLALQNVASFAVQDFARASIFRLSLRASGICF